MAVPTTITGRYYKRKTVCRRVLHKHIIRKFSGESRAAKCLGYPFTSLSFGPFYSESADRKWDARKEQTWKHVLRSSKEPETTRLYREAIKRIESEARALYEDEESLDRLSSDEFIAMMIKDGCFMLQVALCALGGWKLLSYPLKDSLFGEEGGDKETINRIVTLMFVLGNQLPLIVLKELMKQSFFQKVLHSGKWKRPMDVRLMVVFDFLIVPVMTGRNHVDDPCDILHGLWLLLIGPRCSTNDADDKDESSDGDEDDDSALYGVPSATELKLSGVSFEDNAGMGTRGIRFNKNLSSTASLSLPELKLSGISFIDDCTTVLFKNLMRYEFVQQISPNRHEVCAYLRLMCELICTPDDAKLLADHGIIICHPRLLKTLSNILSEFPLPDVKCNRNLHVTRVQIRNFQKCTGRRIMWEKRLIVAAAILLCIVVVLQILSLILQFHQKPEPAISFVPDVGVPIRVVKDALIHQKLEI